MVIHSQKNWGFRLVFNRNKEFRWKEIETSCTNSKVIVFNSGKAEAFPRIENSVVKGAEAMAWGKNKSNATTS